MKSRIQWERGPAPEGTDAAHMTSRHIVLVRDRSLSIFELDGRAARLENTRELAFEVDRVWISPTGRWLALRQRDGNRLDIVDRRDPGERRTIGSEQRNQKVTTELCRYRDQEIAITATRVGLLEGLALDSGENLVSFSFPTFGFADLTSVGSGSHVLLTGDLDGDSVNSLMVVDLAQPPGQAREQFTARSGLMDSAYRLCAGPCGRESYVVFRDPEDDEDEEPEAPDTRAGFWGLHGAYVRRMDGTVTQQIAVDAEWRGCGPAAGGPSTLAAAGQGLIHLVDRVSEQATTVPGRWLAAAPDGARVLVEQDGELAMLDL